MKISKWMYPGMRVKRWLLLTFFGIILISAGLNVILDVTPLGVIEQKIIRTLLPLRHALGRTGTVIAAAIGIVGGAFLIISGMAHAIRSIAVVLAPDKESDQLADLIYSHRHLEKGPQIVVIGGGTGLSTMLRGLKKYTNRITAIVTVADDGGSSGRIRDELGILPPGDIRNTLAALADTEPLMEKLFQYRFDWGEGLEGHSFGNLFIAAMTDITGDFELAIQQSSRVLAIRGRVLPSTLQEVKLRATYDDGTQVTGESLIPLAGKPIKRIEIIPEDCVPVEEALEAIGNADAIVLGPGSLYTSIMPNLLVKDIAEAIRKSKAPKIYVCNVMSQPGETDGYTASDHVQAIVDHVGKDVIDYVLVNIGEIPEHLLEKYESQGAYPVKADIDVIKQMGFKPIARPMISLTNLVRHNPDELAKCILEVIWRNRILRDLGL